MITGEVLEYNGFDREDSSKYTKEFESMLITAQPRDKYCKVLVETDDFAHEFYVRTSDQMSEIINFIKTNKL